MSLGLWISLGNLRSLRVCFLFYNPSKSQFVIAYKRLSYQMNKDSLGLCQLDTLGRPAFLPSALIPERDGSPPPPTNTLQSHLLPTLQSTQQG